MLLQKGAVAGVLSRWVGHSPCPLPCRRPCWEPPNWRGCPELCLRSTLWSYPDVGSVVHHCCLHFLHNPRTSTSVHTCMHADTPLTHGCMQTCHSHMHACRHAPHTCMHADMPLTHACRHTTHTSALVRKSMSSIFSLRARLNKPGQSTSNSQYTGNRPASSMLDLHAAWRVGHWLHLDNCPNAISCSLAPPPPRLLPARQGAPVSPALPGLQ